MPNLSISVAERNQYRALAHHLKPVVLMGEQGLTDAVLEEIDTHLQAHQLIKIRVNEPERSKRTEYYKEICSKLQAEPIHHIGKTVTIYRRNPFKPTLLDAQDDGEIHNPMRRARNEPYTPKKYAAQGLRKTRSGRIKKK